MYFIKFLYVVFKCLVNQKTGLTGGQTRFIGFCVCHTPNSWFSHSILARLSKHPHPHQQ